MSRAELECDSLACIWLAIYLQEAVIGGGGEVNMGEMGCYRLSGC